MSGAAAKGDSFDVIVAGGSIAGLLAAREAARAGLSVAVLEEDSEIGTPEHCGGLVSMEGIKNLGIIPGAVENAHIRHARILSKSSGFDLAAERQKVVVLDRRELDKQVALQAQRAGAEIRVKCSVRSFGRDAGGTVKTSEGDLACKYFVDARGVASIINRNREGVLSSAQYEVYAPWIARDTIEVAFDSERFPGFFAWVIPSSAGGGQGKVGVAGRGINAAAALKSYMDSKGSHYSVVRKVYAPIWVGGPIENFVSGRTVIVGDAAGQTKPTTAGGIYTCGMGGMLAGRAIAQVAESGEDRMLVQYQRGWESMFKAEFDKMLLARRLLERLDNKAIDDLFAAIPKDRLEDVSSSGDFDFHSAALSKMLGARGAAKMARALLGNEIRRLVDGT
jgi:geranylgeranyl reductase family protein